MGLIISEIKENLRDSDHKKAFIRAAIETYPSQFICTNCGTTGWQAFIKQKYMRTMPNYGSQLLVIGYALHKLNYRLTESPNVVESSLIRLKDKYSQRIEEKYLIRREAGKESTYCGWKQTDYLSELLARDFRYKADVNIPKGNHYLYVEKFNLVYKLTFPDIDDAELYFDRVKLLDYVRLLQKNYKLNDNTK